MFTLDIWTSKKACNGLSLIFFWQLAKLRKIRQDQENLPIYQYKSMIIEAVKEHQVVVVAGDTGCGKSTQVGNCICSGGGLCNLNMYVTYGDSWYPM